ncbi:MAG: DUF302 domain-containing protein [Pseudomonadota bacterium]
MPAHLFPSLLAASILLALALFPARHVSAADGLVALKSPHVAKATLDKLEALARDKGLHIFARIDHAAGAARVGKALRPTELLIFGSPQGGTPFMECVQTVGIDLPLKALAWEDAQGQTWLGYNDPVHLARRHGAADCPAAEKLGLALEGLAKASVAP